MARLSLKPDSSFFKKIAVGAVGARAVMSDLSNLGHDLRELENGSTDTKIWKDVKRKRVRIPDLVCIRCGLRIESRAKTNPTISMSHSRSEAERAWDYGLVDTDVVAFPICDSATLDDWSIGRLTGVQSYWRSKERIRWNTYRFINYFTVSELRSVPYSQERIKGVTEGAETSVSWDAIISTRDGVVVSAENGRIAIRRDGDGHRYSWDAKGMPIRVTLGQRVSRNQVIASQIRPLRREELTCRGELPERYIEMLLTSPERSQRFTGVKLARLRGDINYEDAVRRCVAHRDEDIYVKLEGVIYLARVCGDSVRILITPYLNNSDKATQLESVIALAETATDDAVAVLAELLHNVENEYFLRSAAAWALGRIGTRDATEHLLRAFEDVELRVREEALEALSYVSREALDVLISRVIAGPDAVAAGAAEAVRRQLSLDPSTLTDLVQAVNAQPESLWPVWLLGHLPKELVAPMIVNLEERNPKAHFAIAVLWAFTNSWIAVNWELNPRVHNTTER